MIKKRSGNAGEYRSGLAAAIHETVAGLYRIDLIDKAAMREFDGSCLTSIEPRSAKEVVAKGKRAGVSRKDPL